MFTSISQLHSHILDRKKTKKHKMLNLKIKKKTSTVYQNSFWTQTSPIDIDHGWIDWNGPVVLHWNGRPSKTHFNITSVIPGRPMNPGPKSPRFTVHSFHQEPVEASQLSQLFRAHNLFFLTHLTSFFFFCVLVTGVSWVSFNKLSYGHLVLNDSMIRDSLGIPVWHRTQLKGTTASQLTVSYGKWPLMATTTS